MHEVVDEEEVHVWRSTQQSVNKTDIYMLIFCFITHTTTCFNLYDHLQVVLTGVLMFRFSVVCWLLQRFIL
jgi:hypothetical protein